MAQQIHEAESRDLLPEQQPKYVPILVGSPSIAFAKGHLQPAALKNNKNNLNQPQQSLQFVSASKNTLKMQRR